MKKIIFRNEFRKAIEQYLSTNDKRKEYIDLEKVQKKEVMELLATLGNAENTSDSTNAMWGYVMEHGEEVPVVYKETTKDGAIDWQAYAMALGGNLHDAEKYRKAPTVTRVVERMSKAMRKQLGV